MVVQFTADAQGVTPKPPGPNGGVQPPTQNPEQVRQKWDALLNVINNVSSDAAEGGDASQRPPLRAARELVSETSAAKRQSPGNGRRTEWNTRHHLLYSTVNHRMQRNIRSYFGRMREMESYGLRYDEPLRTTWQLDTPEDKPPLGTLRGHYAKFNTPQNSPSGALPAIGDSPGGASSQMGSTGMSRSKSDPGLVDNRETGWNGRHHVVFQKDNHHYHSNMRAYFERPREVLW